MKTKVKEKASGRSDGNGEVSRGLTTAATRGNLVEHTTFALRKDIRPDAGQPRKDFPEADQLELQEDIKVNGIVEALVVRKDPDGKTKWLLVEGERRLRCAEALQLERVPIVERAFADEAAVRKFQRIVGTRRLNINALEEAAALDKELKVRQGKDKTFTVAQLGEEMGMPRSVVYERLALVNVSPAVRAALLEGKLDASKARLFARVPAEQHAQVLRQATQEHYNGGVMSFRKLKELIDENFCRQLSGAPWKWEDATLVKAAGPCSTCPKRSGNIPGMDGSPSVCTDVKCFGFKLREFGIRKIEEAKANKQATIQPEAYQKKSYEFERADKECWEDDRRRSWSTLAKKAGIEPAVTVDENGAVLEVFKREQKEAILKANKISGNSSGRSQADLAAERKRRKREEQYDAAAKLATVTILEKLVTKKGLHPKLWLMLSDQVANDSDIFRETFVAKRLGIARTQNESREALEGWLTNKERTDLDRQRFMVEILICALWNGGGWRECKWEHRFEECAKLAGVNLDKLLKQAATSASPKATARQAKGKV